MANYTGYKIITPDNPFLCDFYASTDKCWNLFDALENEYIMIADADGEIKEKWKWDGNRYIRLNYKPIENAFSGMIKPRNPQQCLAFDMLQDEKTTIKVLSGNYGSGKTMLMVVHALDLIESGKVEKLVWVRNNIEVKDTGGIGFLPGSQMDKMLPWAGPLLDHIGGIDELYSYMDQGKIEVQHLGYIRGRDIRNSIIMSTEAENLTKQHVQLLIGRVGEGSQLFLDGDHRQVDKQVFKDNSGLAMAVEKLKGNKLFGYVDLPISERSETARLADLLDEP